MKFTDEGLACFRQAIHDVFDYSGEQRAEHFQQRFAEDMSSLCQSIAEEIEQGGRPAALPDPEASVYLSRPAYRHRLETVKKRARRSSVGLRNIVYVLSDESRSSLPIGEGKPDTIKVYLIKHSSSPLTFESHDMEDESE